MQLPTEVPVMTLPDVILFPQAMLPLKIFEPRYRKMLADALTGHRMFALAMQKPGSSRGIPVSTAGLGLIRACVTNRDGTSNLILQGIGRVELQKAVRYRPYRVNRVRHLASSSTSTVTTDALTTKVLELVGERLQLGFSRSEKALKEMSGQEGEGSGEPLALQAFKQVIQHLTKLEDPEQLADLVSATLLPDARERLIILETRDLEGRLRFLVRFLMAEIDRQKQNKS